MIGRIRDLQVSRSKYHGRRTDALDLHQSERRQRLQLPAGALALSAAAAQPGTAAAPTAARGRRRLCRLFLDRHRCIASLCDGGTEFQRVGLPWLDPNPTRCQVDLNLGTRIDGPNRLCDGAGAVATGHVADFKGNHCYTLMVISMRPNVKLPMMGMSRAKPYRPRPPACKPGSAEEFRGRGDHPDRRGAEAVRCLPEERREQVRRNRRQGRHQGRVAWRALASRSSVASCQFLSATNDSGSQTAP
ncbi:hypothetical protein WDL1CHR_04978 [Variovorax sp. WDL1]|nr:hypothetical protein CHC06_07005 [Variovorax sp. B2]PNG48687.1 hypothetical protein CHC07_07863 [Variovorax sp. B4]VTV14448.1 hypothetical protein WDL1CHR_04978 [Variovorax sp. WDL1]